MTTAAILFVSYVFGAGSVAGNAGDVEHSQYLMPSLAECRATARQMVDRAKVGRMKAFCRKVEAS